MASQNPRSTEYLGLGQSGYTAGRIEGDHAIERQLVDRNRCYPYGVDLEGEDAGADDRFTGRGGPSNDRA